MASDRVCNNEEKAWPPGLMILVKFIWLLGSTKKY